MTLDRLPQDRPGRVTGVAKDGVVSQRLQALGFLPGAAVRIVMVAPLGDPITVDLEGWRISLRREQAALVSVEPEEVSR